MINFEFVWEQLKSGYYRLFNKNDSIGYAELLVSLGSYEFRKGNPQRAITYLEESIQLFSKLGKYDNELYLLGITYLSSLMLDFAEVKKSQTYALEAYEIQKRYHSTNSFLLNKILSLLAMTYYTLGQHLEGDKYFDLASKNQNLDLQNWKLFFAKGMALFDKQKYADASKTLYSVSLLLDREVPRSDISYLVYSHFAVSEAKRLGYDKRLLTISEEILQESLKVYSEINTPLAFNIYCNIAWYFLEMGDINKSIELINYIISKQTPQNTNYPAFQNILLMFGNINESIKNYHLALNSYQTALRTFLKVFSNWFLTMNQTDKYIYLNKTYHILNIVFEFLSKHSNDWPNFIRDVFEYRVRSRNLLYSDYDKFSKLYTKFESLVKVLKNDEAYVEILRSASSTSPENIIYLIFIVTSNTKEHPKLIILENGLEIEQSGYVNYIKNIQNKSVDLLSYKKIWKDIDTVLLTKKKIFYSADGIFRIINPEAFWRDYQGILFEEREFIVINSIDSLINRDYKIKLDEATLVGNPKFSIRDIDLKDALKKIKLTPIPETQKEVDAIKQVLSKNEITTRLFVNENATKQNLLAHIESNVLHIATHSIQFDNKYNEQIEELYQNYGLLLSGSIELKNDSVNFNKEGILYSDEILNHNLNNTDLAILSSCKSGIGGMQNLGEMVGFPLSLLSAGCKFVIVSLWLVDDKVTMELFYFFYEDLLMTKNPVLSLRNAKKQIKKMYDHPYFWAGFQIIAR